MDRKQGKNMRKFRIALLAASLSMLPVAAIAQQEGFKTREQVIHETAYWTGERFADGRPKVPDAILDRMKRVTLEEAWDTLRRNGFLNQYEDGWNALYPGKVLVGRALTSTWMPGRPDSLRIVEEDGRAAGRTLATNSWPVDMLQQRDVYVSDHFGLKINGASIGDNVGNAIYARTGNGIVYDGAVRDVNGLREMPNFTSFFRHYDPGHHFGRFSEGNLINSTLVAINAPTRIGQVLVMPGDVILGRDGIVMAIPPQLAEQVVRDSERTHLRDLFGHQRLAEKKYTAGQIDGRWSDEIEADYTQWLRDNLDKTDLARAQVQEILDERLRPRPAAPQGGPGRAGAGRGAPGVTRPGLPWGGRQLIWGSRQERVK
jgi:regulator of RNase E activity RraA